MVIIWMDTSRGITKKEFQEVLTVDFHAGITGPEEEVCQPLPRTPRMTVAAYHL